MFVEKVWYVEKVVGMRVTAGKKQYHIKWQGSKQKYDFKAFFIL